MNIYVQRLKAIKVEERKVVTHISGAGANAVMGEVSEGWVVHLDNYFAINVGLEKPDIKEGDDVILSLRKKQDVKLTEVDKPEKKITFAPDERPQ